MTRLRTDIRAAIRDGQADGSIRADVDDEACAHAIVAEGIGSAFVWIVDPTEDVGHRIAQWRNRTHTALAP